MIREVNYRNSVRGIIFETTSSENQNATWHIYGEWSIGKVKSQVRDQQGYPCWSPDKELIWRNSVCVCVLGWESARKGTLWVVKRQSRQNNKENEKNEKRRQDGYPPGQRTSVGLKQKASREDSRQKWPREHQHPKVAIFLTPTLASLCDTINRQSGQRISSTFLLRLQSMSLH